MSSELSKTKESNSSQAGDVERPDLDVHESFATNGTKSRRVEQEKAGPCSAVGY